MSINDKGAVAQLGERLTGSQEVVGSIPSGSTNQIFNYSPSTKTLKLAGRYFT